MKCGIVTVYSSENCGSFLQAYALAHALEQKGHEAAVVKHAFQDHAGASRRYCKNVALLMLRGRFSAARKLVQRRKAFRQAIGKLKVVPLSDKMDCYFFGSDTIWDLSVPFFRNHRDFFWGASFEKARLISYAPSMGATRQIAGEQGGFVSKALNHLDHISVRDHAEKELLQPYSEKPISVVCDPTLLLKQSDYQVMEKPSDLRDFVFIYYYGKMPQDYIREIQTFAKEKGLKTVIFGNGNDWCDRSVAYDPLLFLSLYRDAAYVVTNTFHGTVFSHIYGKKFAVIKNEKPKVVGFLKQCQTSDKMTETAADLRNILESEYDYETIGTLLAQARDQGLDYLEETLRGKP